MAALHNVTLFLMNIFFSFCIFVILLRIMLQCLRANANNPICQMVAKVTNPVVLPLRNILPRLSFIDLSSVVVFIALEILKFTLIPWVQSIHIGLGFILLMSFTDILLQIVDVIFYAIIIRVVLSWINSPNTMYLGEIVFILTEPILGRIRRFLPAMGGLDLSPLVAFILLQIVNIVILSYLPS